MLRPKDCIITMLTFNTKDPSSCGIVKKDKEGKVIEFHEKSERIWVIAQMEHCMLLIKNLLNF